MKIMSHNSWTFLKPRTFLGRIFNFTAKCQSKDIQEQYEKYNVRCFDLRLKLDKYNKATLAHGLFEYKIDNLKNDLEYLNSKGDVSIRVLLEVRNSSQDTEIQRNWFIKYCKELEDDFQNLRLFGGYPTYNGVLQYFKFKNGLIPSMDGQHASWTTKCKIDDLWPWLYAKINNKKSYKRETDAEFLSLDFVEYGSVDDNI